ncbi:MAG: hypothetical protein KKB50_09500 [Planctomycetes bacterium]|nr:hypothetical protein [Planctomycetota bacterium]
MDIALGTNVSIEVTASPTRAAARKTLARILCKDPAVAHDRRRRSKMRPSWQTWIRGGRHWHHQMKSKPLAIIAPGVKYTVFATVDVLRDLESVQRWVKVTPAT